LFRLPAVRARSIAHPAPVEQADRAAREYMAASKKSGSRSDRSSWRHEEASKIAV